MTELTWRQYTIAADHERALSVACDHLVPALTTQQETGRAAGWWYLRKPPGWRWRCLADPAADQHLREVLSCLTTEGRIDGWAAAVYEPETEAFGGPDAMAIAHRLFHHDSHALLNRAGHPIEAPRLGWRETTVVLLATMQRAAGLDWFEQGATWAYAAEHLRPEANDHDVADLADQVPAMRTLMRANPTSLCDPDRPGPLAGAADWVAAFERAGQALGALYQSGRMTRGLRAVLAHHIIFHANRAGLPLTEQASMVALARRTVFGDRRDAPLTAPTGLAAPTTLRRVTTLSESVAASAGDRRTALVSRLTTDGIIRTTPVRDAMTAVARHLFLPGVTLDSAYADDPVYVKTDGSGARISAASQPRIVALMQELLAAQPGEAILELGAGTGYNAALTGHIVGPTGRVVTLDIDQDLVDGARGHLTAAGIGNVEVICRDGALGHPDGGPYDRIIATVGLHDIPHSLLTQLRPGGRLVVPLRLRGAATRILVLEQTSDGWEAIREELGVFMPLRGIGDDARTTVALGDEVTLQLHHDQHVDPIALAGVLHTPAHTVWTGVLFPPNTPYAWMDLWLALRLPGSIMRMSTPAAAVESGLVTPMFPTWGAMATVNDTALAYLTLRTAPAAPDGGKHYEVGVVGHGPGSGPLADQVADEIRLWDNRFRHRTVRFTLLTRRGDADPDAGRFVLLRPEHPITVTWD